VNTQQAPEREKTDESLRRERRNTDEVIEERRQEEQVADEVVERARDQADAVLDSAREKADDKLGAGDCAGIALATERAEEDQALEAERATADEALRREREENARLLFALLPLERERTDKHLLSERARADDALANRDDFMGIVSHDLRNLLAGIASTAALLAAKASTSDEGKRSTVAAGRIQRHVALMNRLLGDLVDIASIDAGKLSVVRERIDAAPLLAEAVDAFAAAAAGRGIALALDSAGEPLVAELDRTRILQVLANLIGNALKFTPRGGRVSVRGEVSPDGIALHVVDTGRGIPADMLEAVFARFTQVEPTDLQGLGLGLYITRCIIDGHGGRVWAERRPEGGTAFHLTLPSRRPAQLAHPV